MTPNPNSHLKLFYQGSAVILTNETYGCQPKADFIVTEIMTNPTYTESEIDYSCLIQYRLPTILNP